MTSVEEVQSHSQVPAVVSDVSGTSESRHQYFMLTNVLPEDKELRATLWAERLVRTYNLQSSVSVLYPYP
jgi:DNA/RNA endonuclease G (NUC1)